jgi:hypothetical protein
MKTRSLAVTLLFVCCALAQPSPSIFRGSWIATVGPTRFFSGRWSGELLPNTRNAAQGSWTLLSEKNQIVLEGTWSARKSSSGWQGAWTARVTRGRSFSGTWQADMAGFNGKTFEDMLQRTLEKQVSGAWRSGRMQGNWWLQSSR